MLQNINAAASKVAYKYGVINREENRPQTPAKMFFKVFSVSCTLHEFSDTIDDTYEKF